MVFSLDLEAICVPVLVIAHADDKCIRTPPQLAAGITKRTSGVREQLVTVTGGPGRDGPADVNSCKGRSPHGFIGQEEDVIAGIAREPFQAKFGTFYVNRSYDRQENVDGRAKWHLADRVVSQDVV